MGPEISELDGARRVYEPRVPDVLCERGDQLVLREGAPTSAAGDAAALRTRFPRTFGRPRLELARGGSGLGLPARALAVGVVFSGGQAPGGHNVLAGLLDGLLAIDPRSRLVGFLDGPRGIVTARSKPLPAELVSGYRNTGGFDLLGTGRDKIETREHFAACQATCEQLDLDGLVIIGGDDSNTNAALLAEHFAEVGCRTAVLGVPKTIDGDLKGEGVETSFGFDTATKIYAELVGNICRDAASSRKYWHFVRLMGRSASHVTLECALATRPNVTLIGEELREQGRTLGAIVDEIGVVVRARAAAGRRHGVLLVPEGLIEFVPEMRTLIDELNRLLAEGGTAPGATPAGLSEASRTLFATLPERIRQQLLLDRDAHGNVQVSKIDTELLLIEMLRERLGPAAAGVQGHFFGYEGRSAQPTNFDADYTYALGRCAAWLAAAGCTGYMCSLAGLAGPPRTWRAGGIPLTAMMRLETRKGSAVPVIAKALVRTEGAPFRALAAARRTWADADHYRYPGAIQYFGPPELCDRPPYTLGLEYPVPDGR